MTIVLDAPMTLVEPPTSPAPATKETDPAIAPLPAVTATDPPCTAPDPAARLMSPDAPD